MPVAVLLVEGDLDVAVLNAVKPVGGPVIEKAGSKDSLPHEVRRRREGLKKVDARYLRDRDFDFEPPGDTLQPTVDRVDRNDADVVLGWRWCRHAIESYLLGPGLVAAATDWAEAEFAAALVDAGRRIAHYTAARWVLGLLRERVMGAKLLANRPRLRNEIKLPEDRSPEGCVSWMLDTTRDWRERVDRPTDDEAREEHHRRATALLALDQPTDVLLWHSGKDLLAALAEPLKGRARPNNPKELCSHLRDFIREAPEAALEHLPEWGALFRGLTVIA